MDFFYKNRVNSSKFNATILKFTETFDHPFLHVFIFGNMFPESHGFVAVPVTRSNNFVSLNKLEGYIGTCIFETACNRHSNETVTVKKHVSKYKNLRKWKIEFLRKFEHRGSKIIRVNSILITKSFNLQFFTLILYGVGVRRDVWRSVLSPLIEKSMSSPW